MIGHTPGPWKRGEEHETMAEIQASATPFPVVARALCGRFGWARLPNPQEMQANARLIAAAPEMLEALESLALMAETDPALGDMARIARAAIAKATRSTP